MVDVTMKYKIGDKVRHFTGINGMIVKVFNDTNNYLFVYVEDGGKLSQIEIEECEIDEYMDDNFDFGFCKK